MVFANSLRLSPRHVATTSRMSEISWAVNTFPLNR